MDQTVSLPKIDTDAFMREPGAAIARLQAAGPLVTMKLPLIGRTHVTTTHELTVAVLKDGETFTQRTLKGEVAGLRSWMPRFLRVLGRNMLTMDGDDHRRLRGLVDEAFQRRNVAAMEPRIRELANELVEELPKAPETAELVDGFASRLPLAVICELLGLPRKDWPRFMRWAGGFTAAGSVLGFLRAIPNVRSLMRYIEHRIAAIGSRDGGLIAELVAMHDPDDPVAREELVAMAFLLLVAGHQTTTHLISGAVLTLLENPEQRRFFLENPGGHGMAVEEFLRFVSPVQLSKPRTVRRELSLGGVDLKPGDMVMAFIAAANRDPAMFDNPERLDIARKPNRHVAFGTGVHFCLGHQLARMEARAALEALFGRFPDLRLAVDPCEIRYHPRIGMRAMRALPVTLAA